MEYFINIFERVWDILFHRCTFDSAKWKKLGEYNASYVDSKTKERLVSQIQFIYTNTCLKCGKLTEKLISTGKII